MRNCLASACPHRAGLFQWCVLGLLVALPATARAQLVPEIGYMLPAGGRPGTTCDAVLGGYDWTPDMQLFVHDPEVRLELTGRGSDVLIAEPPYWFGYKARGYAWPLPREFPARLSIPANRAPGLVKWQVANANGASPPAQFFVSPYPEVSENPHSRSIQVLPQLPVTVSGQVRRIEQIDRYQFLVNRPGPVTVELWSRRLGSPLHGMVTVRDPAGRVLLDIADTVGRDFAATFAAEANVPYELRLNDLDFAGDRSYVYRLVLTVAPSVASVFPAALRRGETQLVEFLGVGLSTGAGQVESLTRTITAPADSSLTVLDYSLETPYGTVPVRIPLSDLAETVKPASGQPGLVGPGAVTGFFTERFGTDVYAVTLSAGKSWQIDAAASTPATTAGPPLDLELSVTGPDGKPVATSDDIPGTTDARVVVAPAADGIYQVSVIDRSGRGGTRTAGYRLSATPVSDDLELSMPSQINLPLGGTAKLTVKATRKGAWKEPIPLVIQGLPAGVTVPADLIIPEGKNELAIDLTCAADAAVAASLCRISTQVTVGGRMMTRAADPGVVAITLKPRFKLTPEGLDDVRKVHRGSTYLFPMLIERLEGYQGSITLEMTAKQQRHRQGLASDEFVIPPDAQRVEYPIFVPEWMETTKTSRMILNGRAEVTDPKGNVRTVLQRQELRFGILPEGALLKLTHSAGEPRVTAGMELPIPIQLSVASELQDPIQVTVHSAADASGLFQAQPLNLVPGQKEARVIVHIQSGDVPTGEHELTLRAKAMQHGKWPVISETTVIVEIQKP